uniref:Sodium/hydrogen exchanger n=1 Tax=Syphacia muris TaxID=451379 RepID=A0A0N5AM00_9BILA
MHFSTTFALALEIFLISSLSSVSDGFHFSGGHIEQAAEKRAQSIHRTNTLILMVYVALLVLIVLTAWFFKKHRFLFIHETGLTLCYGLLIGVLLRYTNIGVIESETVEVVPKGGTFVKEPPDYLRLEVIPDSLQKVQFHYELIEGFFGDKAQQEERQVEQKTVFSPETFFNMLLPPIIFNAGYSLKKRHFFRNIGSILTFVFIGTTISSLGIGILMYVFALVFNLRFTFKELFFFGSILSATDPITVLAVFQEMRVEADLFALVFGERSLLLGSVIGCTNALITKMTSLNEYPLLESALFILLSYLSFLLAEFVELTGIVAALFCAICQAHYTYNNLSEDVQSRTKQFFEVISFLSESFIFCCIGVSVFVTHKQKWNVPFIFAALVSMVASRAMFVYPLSALLNLKRVPKISKAYQHMLLFSGLRGAMAFALASRNTATDNKQIMATTTAILVIFTVFVNGSLTSWIIDKLNIKYNLSFIVFCIFIHSDIRTGSGQNPWDKSFLPRKWYNFDAMFMKPLLTHAIPTLMDTLPNLCMPFAKFFTSTKQLNLLFNCAE